MITEQQVIDIFRTYLPPGVVIRLVDAQPYVERAQQHPYIQKQIELGIYSKETLHEDFLSPAVSYTTLNCIDVCYDLLAAHMQGVEEHLSIGYVVALAIHEAHHFAVGPVATFEEHAQQELDAAAAVLQHDDIADLQAQFERASPVYQRVYARMQAAGLLGAN